MLTTLIHANYCLLSLFITWRKRLFKKSSKSSDNSCFQLWIIFCSFSLFHKGSHWISFHFFFFSLPDMAIISFLGFVRKIHRKCLSPGANLRETACLSLQGAVIRRQPQAHQVYCTKTGGETPTWLSSYGTIILCPEFQSLANPFVLQPLPIKCTSWNNTNLISYLQLTLSAHKVLVWRVDTLHNQVTFFHSENRCVLCGG